MDEWIQALKNTSIKEFYQSNKEILNGTHSWYVCSHARPTFCNVCREALNGVTSHGLSCEICKFKAHKRCAQRASRNCKWTTLASIGSKEIIEDEDRNICMPHQWLEGNLPVNAKCSYCEKTCGSVLRMQDFRCLWCKSYVHSHCKDNFYKQCNLGVCKVSILPPTHVNEVASDGYIRASKAPNSSPLVVFVNSKSGDNQGVKFLRKFKQLLNPFQVFDLIQGGPVVGLRLFQKFDCFRVLVCGGDGSVGWVLKEIDALNLHKQCQIGVLPLGTGNDLARVLGWGAVLDDDNQLPKLLESFERATTKMLDRWSIMTYELQSNATSKTNNANNMIKSHSKSVIPLEFNSNSKYSSYELKTSINNNSIEENITDTYDKLDESICQNLNSMLQNENINNVIDSTIILNEKINELLYKIYNAYNINSKINLNESKFDLNGNGKKPLIICSDEEEEENRKQSAMATVINDQCVNLKCKLDDFFILLKNELRTTPSSIHSGSLNKTRKNATDSETSAAFTATTSSTESDNDNEENYDYGFSAHNDDELMKKLINRSPSKQASTGISLITHMGGNFAESSANTLTPQDSRNQSNKNHKSGISSCNSSINRRLMLNSISKLFRHRRKIMTRANGLKKLIKQLIKLADKDHSSTTNNNNCIDNQNELDKNYNHNIENDLSYPKLNTTIITNKSTTLHNTTITSSSNSNNTVPTTTNTTNSLDINNCLNHQDEDFEDEGYIQNDFDLNEDNNQDNLLAKSFDADNLNNSSIYYQHRIKNNLKIDLISSSIDYDKQNNNHISINSGIQVKNLRPNTLNISTSSIALLSQSSSSNKLNSADRNSSDIIKRSMNDIATQIQIEHVKEKLEKLNQLNPEEVNNGDYDTINDKLKYASNKQIDNSNSSDNADNLIKNSDNTESNGNFNDSIINELSVFERNRLFYSFTSSSISNETQHLLAKSPSGLTINKSLCMNGANGNDQCPLASEEQSCMSTPNTAKFSPSIDSIYKQNMNNQLSSIQIQPQLSRPNKLNLIEKNYLNNGMHRVSITVQSPSIHELSLNSSSHCLFKKNENINNKIETNTYESNPHITIQCENDDARSINYDTDSNHMYNSRSPSFLGYITSASSAAITPEPTTKEKHFNLDVNLNENGSSLRINKLNIKAKKQTPPPLFLLPPSPAPYPNRNNFNSSSSSNNLSAKLNEFSFGSSLGIPASPSGYSSSGSCFSKTPLPSPRISKKYCKETKNYLQLPGQGVISALSVNIIRRRSRSKSSDKSSSPTSPPSPKFSFKYNPHSSPFGFIGQALLFNADTLCAPITTPTVNEPILDLYNEKAVMNNYFGIGLDAKLCLDFHLTREEHPEKCKSRIRNHMLYGFLGSKELVQRTYKNLEQKVLLECDGTKIPLKNVQGIVVLNIPSYTGGVNFWGQNSKDEDTFILPSFDDKILEVVAVSGCMQMALSRVVSIKSNRIAQCRSVKIQILGQEGVPVQVDGEAWIQPPGFIYLTHKNRAQMLTRNKVFEHTLKTWSEKQKNDPHISSSLTKEEFTALQCIVDDSITLIKRIKTASLKNSHIEQDLCGYANQASSNLEEISINGKLLEKSLRQQLTDFLNSIRTLHVESGLFINEKSLKLCIEQDIIEKIQLALNDLKADMKKLNDCHGIFQFPIDSDEDLDLKRKSRFNIVQRYKKSKIKHKDDKELLKTLHSIPIEEWGPEEVGLWLESLNLSEYKAAFLRHDIRGTEIRNLERRDIRELGIVKVGHIKRILNASKDIPKRVAIEKQSV